MKKLLALLTLLLLFGTCALAEDYVNPIRVYNPAGQISDAADNFVMRYNGRYYLYNFSEYSGRSYVSDDLVHWEYVGYTFAEAYPDAAFYAPEVFCWRGQFLLLTSLQASGTEFHPSHSFFISDSPSGPFRRVSSDQGLNIDGTMFVKDDGTLWMAFAQEESLGMVEIDPETITPKGLRFRTDAGLYDWTEGPGLFRRGDYYFLTYTGNHYLSSGYRVAWSSRKDDPVGRYESIEDNILLINSVFGDPYKGLGHSSNVIGPDLDSIYSAYHAHAPLNGGTAPGQYALARWYCLDRLLTNGGTLYTTGASSTAMPVPEKADISGDVQGDAGGWTKTADGWMAEAPAATRFTQECNFALDGGTMAWRMGSVNGEVALIETDGQTIRLTVGGEESARAAVPELGEADRLHALRIENTQEITYVYIDSMRLLTVERLSVQADVMGALDRDGVRYSFMAYSAKALGDSDCTAVKLIPGNFDAVHAVSETGTERVNSGVLDAQALVLGEAKYNVRVAEAGEYCFDLTVRAADEGRTITLSLADSVITAVVPECPDSKEEWFTFTTPPVALPAGNHMLTISSDGAALWKAEGFAWTAVPETTWNLVENDRQGIITLGNFFARNGSLNILPDKTGYALIGDEGWTDVEMHVRFLLPKEGTGTSGLLMRATDVALYEKPVENELFGYMVSVSQMGLTIREAKYNEGGRTEFVPIPTWKEQTEGELILRARGAVLEIFLSGSSEPVYTLQDASPFSHGLCGLYSNGKEFTVTELSVKPIKE